MKLIFGGGADSLLGELTLGRGEGFLDLLLRVLAEEDFGFCFFLMGILTGDLDLE